MSPRTPATLRLLPAVLLLVLLAAPDEGRAAEPALVHGDLATWTDGRPEGWQLLEGARRDPADTPSRCEPLEGGGAALVGDARTDRWQLLAQRVPAPPGTYLELAFTARARGLRSDPGQFGSSYVGFIVRGADGGALAFVIQDVRHEAWREDRVRLRVPAGAVGVDVAVFLSMTGRLEVRGLALASPGPEASFDILVADMDRHYSFFDAHGIDWPAVTRPYAAAARAARDPAAFVAAVRPLLATLQDGHVWIQAPDGSRTWTHTPAVTLNFELPAVLDALAEHTQVIRNVIAGRTHDGFGYLGLGTMQGTPAEYAAVERAFRGLFDAPGLVLDLRVNGGGQEVWGQRLCALLARERTLYARALRRSGPAHDDLAPAGERHLVPAAAGRYEGPVVALIGPGCVSSGEGMALMLKALPQATLVGLPTRGSSGNPAPVALPNGVDVWYSRWISLQPDGTSIERRGVPPDVRVLHLPGRDPALAEAVKILKANAAHR